MSVRYLTDIEIPGISTRLPNDGKPESSLLEETSVMYGEQRLQEQAGLRKWGYSVKGQEEGQRLNEGVSKGLDSSMEEGMENQQVLAHPELANLQYLDGMDMPNPADPFWKTKYNQAKQEQAEQLQHRLELANKLTPGAKPKFNPRPGFS